MEITEILAQFERASEALPEDAVKAAIERREQITPELLRILEDTIGRAQELAEDTEYTAYLYALFLLAQFRETRAYPLVIRLATLPSELLEPLWGDITQESLPAILASVCGGDLTAIQALIESEDTDPWVRWAAVDSLVVLVAVGEKDRDEIVGYFAELFRGKLLREFSAAWEGLIAGAIDLYPGELIEDIRRAYDERLVEAGADSFEEVEEIVAEGKEAVLARLKENPHYTLVDDAAAELGLWVDNRKESAFDTEWDDFEDSDDPDDLADEDLSDPPHSPFYPEFPDLPPVTTYVREAPKVGRNDSCPCGSGKKYKKCCGG